MSFPDQSLVELFDHIVEGYDIPKPSGLKGVKKADAPVLLDGSPYSILTNLAHAVLWQEAWLSALHGEKVASMTLWNDDFRVPDPAEYEDLRTRFVAGLADARAIAAGSPHKAASDDKARTLLLKIAVHGSYHMGQLNLLRRMLKATKT